jgi:hypothetical protein
MLSLSPRPLLFAVGSRRPKRRSAATSPRSTVITSSAFAVRDYLKSDEHIEDIARRILGLVRPGETLVVVSGAPLRGESSTAAATAEPFAQHTPGAECRVLKRPLRQAAGHAHP